MFILVLRAAQNFTCQKGPATRFITTGTTSCHPSIFLPIVFKKQKPGLHRWPNISPNCVAALIILIRESFGRSVVFCRCISRPARITPRLAVPSGVSLRDSLLGCTMGKENRLFLILQEPEAPINGTERSGASEVRGATVRSGVVLSM